MASEEFKSRDLADAVGDLLSKALWWLLLVAAIAIGVALGLYLFFRIVGAEMQDDLHHMWTPPSFPTYATPTYAP
jgi:hypothetical protein